MQLLSIIEKLHKFKVSGDKKHPVGCEKRTDVKCFLMCCIVHSIHENLYLLLLPKEIRLNEGI